MTIPSLLSPTSTFTPLLALSLLLPSLTRADIAIVIEEFTDRVEVRYSGTLNTTSFTTNPAIYGSELDPLAGQIFFADAEGAPMGTIVMVAGDPVTGNAPGFGTFGDILGGAFSGDYFVITNTILAYPVAYVSGSPLSGSLTYAGETMESLGIDRNLAPGYAWGLSTGEEVTLEVLTGIKKAEILQQQSAAILQQAAAKKAALLRAVRKLNKDLSKAIASGRKAKVAKLKKSVRNLATQIAQL